MVFTEYRFLVLFLIVLFAYWLARRREWQNALLLAASFVFYGWVHPWYAILLALSTLADFYLALAIARQPARAKRFLGLSLALNLGVLAFFKYFDFFSGSLTAAFHSIGITPDALLVQILLPVGLSFYTLKKLGYVIDVARGSLQPTQDLVAFALFVSFFPQITAGPIDRAQTLLPQIQADRVWRAENFQRAWPLLLMGFFKKLVIADTLRAAVDRVFLLQQPSPFLVLTAAFAFMFEILADFTAYTDISRGISFLLGFQTSENFHAPFLALTPTEFWNRWHITLSTWLRDYIFFPLRRALLRSRLPAWLIDALPPLVTMLVSGIWHGAGWTFVVWGLMFGVWIVVYQALGLGGAWQPSNRIVRFTAWTVMFTFLLTTFLIFRAPSLSWLAAVFQNHKFAGSTQQAVAGFVTLSTALIYSAPLLLKHWMDRRLKPDSIFFDLYYVAATVLIVFYVNSSVSDFIYFHF
jgi:D-alanyl-lipoteichoic acid acyltransferase DltB (MBOAT superfamily)